jgi:restriction system protein
MASKQNRKNKLATLVRLPWWGSMAVGILAFVILVWLVPGLLDSLSPSRRADASPGPLVYFAQALGWAMLLLFGAIGLAALMRAKQIARYRRRAGRVKASAEAPRTSFGPNSVLEPTILLKTAKYLPVPDRPQPEFHAWSLEALRALEWKRFELLTAKYYEAVGFKSETIRAGAEGGVDIKLFKIDPDKPLAVVQCKAWNAHSIGVKEIRELDEAMALEHVRRGIYVTTGIYTTEAQNFGASHPIQLLDGEAFLHKILDLPLQQRDALFHFAYSGDFTTPTCATCGSKMVRRAGRNGPFWGCENYPDCKSRVPIMR